MELDFNKQTQALEEILKMHDSEARDFYKKHFLELYNKKKLRFKSPGKAVEDLLSRMVFIRKDSPAFLAEGDSQLVLRLDTNWAAKAANYLKFGNFYCINIQPNYTSRSIDTLNLLNNEFGFSLSLTVVKFGCEEGHLKLSAANNTYGAFMIVPDLTEGGKYLVRGIHPKEDFKVFKNGVEMKANFDKYLKRLLELYCQCQGRYKNTEVAAFINPVSKDGSSEETAFRKMFFIKVDLKTGNGQIVPGDFNHVFFYNRARDKRPILSYLSNLFN